MSTSPKLFTIGLIGAGAIAEKHMEVLAALDTVKVVAVANRDKERLKFFQEKYKIPHGFTDYQELIKDKPCDAYFVLVNTRNMFSVGKEVLTTGMPTLLEKPPSFSSKETKELIRIAHAHQTRAVVGFNRRFYGHFYTALKEIEKKGPLLGITIEAPERILQVRENKKFDERDTEHWMMLNGSHCIDLLRFFGGKIEEVYAHSVSFKEKYGDNFSATIRFASGVLGTYSSHWNSPGGWRIVLSGIGITAIFSPLEEGIMLTSEGSKKIPIDEVDVTYKQGMYAQAKAFLDFAQGRGHDARLATLADALITQELVESIQSGSLRKFS